MKHSKFNQAFPLLLTLTFFILVLIGLFNHEMWRDELQAWLIARDSSSISDLFNNLKYEGHPGLWYVLLFLVTRFTHNPFAMQILHICIATGTIYIFARFSPFTPLQKVLFAFGYFPFYEYALISRSYGLGVLLIFSFCALFKFRYNNYVWSLITLFLLANTSWYGFIIAISLALTMLLDFISYQNNAVKLFFSSKKSYFAIAVLVVIITLVVWQLIPPLDSPYIRDWYSDKKATTIVYKSYFPVPNLFNFHFRNTNIISLIKLPGKLKAYIMAFLSLSFLFFTSVLFIRKPVVLFLYVFGSLSILFFSYIKFLGYIRHHGHLFILLIACLWISYYYSNSSLLTHWTKKISFRLHYAVMQGTNFAAKYKNKFLIVLLISHVVAAMQAFTLDLVYPFSQSKAVANYIQTQQLDHLPIVGSRDTTVSPLSAYLDKKVYYLESESFGSFIVLSKERQELSETELFKRLSKVIEQKNTEMLLVLNSHWETNKDWSLLATYLNKLDINQLAIFYPSIVEDESYSLYRVNPKKPEAVLQTK